ncbi:MAG: 3-deoxy-8-phosphooctulonate synthase [Ignavibacteriaceae bacterium]|nr:3-deoxy-8-phosphooctulonate synthase [Ignavibacteriaceae bacterium]
MTLNDIKIGDGNPFILIAGPCVVESKKLIDETAEAVKKICGDLGIKLIFKSSYKKANRTSLNSFTGIGDIEALEILKEAGKRNNISVITDVHSAEEVKLASAYVDALQIPAFLCRQTDLLIAAGETGKVVNIKKGQFLAPEDMALAAEKVAATGNKNIMLTERGSTFGYHNLVVDMRSFIVMRESGYPVVMDATHSVQLPSKGGISGGQPKFIKPLARAAAAVGIDALFLEVHPNPSKALSDAASQLPLTDLKDLLVEIQLIDRIIKKY